jgi:lipopolysaccharide/colanic/teichoic acid biosynthesis glycosyltransferase
MDFTIALLGLLILAPFLVLLAICVRWNFGRPIFFSQERPGLGGLPFRIWKFRTMTDDRDEAGNLLPDKQRLTRFGRFLRSTSLDELPELLNVLRGEMSLVGPRPLLMSYLNRYTPEQARRHEVLPGITGWAQIHGRNAISWEEKLDLDLWYVNHQSLWVDIKVLVLTLVAVVKRTGINAADHATMPEFLGTGRERTEERGAA